MALSDKSFDATDQRIKGALSALIDEMPTVGKEEGWKRIQSALYARPARPRLLSRWQVALASLAAVIVLSLGLARLPAVDSLRWRVVFASRDSWGVSWQSAGNLDAITDLPFVPLVVPPDSCDWTLQAISVDRGPGGGAVGLRYKHSGGAVFTLRQTPYTGDSGASAPPNHDARDSRQFLLMVRNLNVAFFLPGAGLSSASWLEDGLLIEVWGQGEPQELLRLIEALVPLSTLGP